MIYLASPYTHKDPKIVEKRYNDICKIAGELLSAGTMLISPIAHCHHIACITELPTSYDFWLEYDQKLIDLCSSVMVVCLDGWTESKGIEMEISYAKKTNKPVMYLDPNTMIATHNKIEV